METRQRRSKKEITDFPIRNSSVFEGRNPRKRYRRKQASEFPINSGASTKKSWTNEEKETLLRAVKKYGYTDLNNICKEFPDKSNGAVRTMINKLKLLGRTRVTEDDCFKDLLRSGLFPGPDTITSQAFKYMTLFEKQPEPEQAAGCDFRALYYLLSKVFIGHPPIDISGMTYETLCYIMAQANHEVYPFYKDEASEYLANLKERKNRKCYSRFASKKTEIKAESSDPLS